jgi:hypothetical protein
MLRKRDHVRPWLDDDWANGNAESWIRLDTADACEAEYGAVNITRRCCAGFNPDDAFGGVGKLQ